jgi:hypothetical protein
MPLLLSGGANEKMRWGGYDPKSIDKWIASAFYAGIIKTKPEAAALYSNQFFDAYNKWLSSSIQELVSVRSNHTSVALKEP